MTDMADSALPNPATPEAFVRCVPFSTSSMQIPASMCIEGLSGKLTGDSWRFFITHQPSNTRLWFDLGVAPDLTLYAPRIQAAQHKLFKPDPAPTSPADDVRSVGADPNDVKYIIASHAHWDHMFTAAAFHPNARVICGAGTLSWTNPGWPAEPDSEFDGRIWNPEKSELPIEEIPAPADAPGKWQPLGPFKNAHDFFGDGSFWIIDAPGHCPGHIAALARMKSKSGDIKWAFLGADCFHCIHFAHFPEAPFGNGIHMSPTGTLHAHPEGAREIIRQTAELKKTLGPNFLIWIAHEAVLEGVWEL